MKVDRNIKTQVKYRYCKILLKYCSEVLLLSLHYPTAVRLGHFTSSGARLDSRLPQVPLLFSLGLLSLSLVHLSTFMRILCGLTTTTLLQYNLY